MESKQIIVNGLATRYAFGGTGKAVLMLHGWGDSLSTFHELAIKLSQSYKVVCLDLPGFGQTQAPEGAWDVTDYAEFVAAFLNKLQLNLYGVVGHSHGGAVVIEGLGSKRFKADKAVLIASAGVRNKATLKKNLLKAGAKSTKLLTIALPKATKKRLRNKLYGVIGSDMTAVPHMEETFRKVVAQDVTSAAALIEVTVLLIYGSDDQATPPSDGELLAQTIPHASISVIQKSGHFVHQDKPVQVTTLITGFLG